MSHDLWQTPRELFEVVNDEFHFDLDACATADDCLVKRFISPSQDALKTPWDADAVWCNPPYSLIGPFVQRAWEQSQEFQNTTVVLIPAYTDPRYWSDFVMKAHEIRFLKGRLAFLEEGKKKTSARFPSVLVVNKWIQGNHYGKSPNQWVWDWRAR